MAYAPEFRSGGRIEIEIDDELAHARFTPPWSSALRSQPPKRFCVMMFGAESHRPRYPPPRAVRRSAARASMLLCLCHPRPVNACGRAWPGQGHEGQLHPRLPARPAGNAQLRRESENAAQVSRGSPASRLPRNVPSRSPPSPSSGCWTRPPTTRTGPTS
jgi:hypothetical protein